MIPTQDVLSYLNVVRGFKANSLRLVSGKLKLLNAWLDGKEISQQLFEDFLLSLRQRELNNNTLNSYICAFNAYVAYLDHKGINKDLKKTPSLPKYRPPIEVLSISEIEAIWRAELPIGTRNFTQTRWNSAIYRVFIMFLSLTGCRFSEAQKIKVSDVDTGRGRVRFTDTKNGDWRAVAVKGELLERLDELITNMGKQPTDYVFSSYNGSKIVATDFSKNLKKLARIAGIRKKVHPHIFRHSYITEMRNRNVPITEVAKIVGHKDIKSTAYYDHVADDSVELAMSQHPLVRNSMRESDILRKYIEHIERFGMDKDSRFVQNISRSDEKVLIELRVSKPILIE